MASQQQQQQPRPWFRLASLAGRPPSQQPTAAPEPQATQPRPRPPFRPLGQAQTQEPGQQGIGVTSVPTSPIRRTSVPTSPVQRPVSPPKPQITAPAAPTASLPTSPIRRPFPHTASVKTSPVKSTQPTASVATSPVKSAPYTGSLRGSPFTVPVVRHTSPPKPAPYTGSVRGSPIKLTPFTAPVVRHTSPPKPAPYTGLVTTAENRQAPTTYSVSTSPPIKHRENVSQRGPSPPSPKHFQKIPSPGQSPKQQKHTAAPPSPLSLPPPYLRFRTEHEPKFPTEKGVLVEQTIEKPKSWPNSGPEPRKEFEGTQTHLKPHHKKSQQHGTKLSSDSAVELGMRVITIAGENKGAFMEVIRTPMKGNHNPHNNNPHTLHKIGYTIKTENDEEDKSKKEKGKHGNSMVSPQSGAFMNSNVQGVNNSLLFNSSCSHHDPGVHLAFSRKPSGYGFEIMDGGHTHSH